MTNPVFAAFNTVQYQLVFTDKTIIGANVINLPVWKLIFHKFPTDEYKHSLSKLRFIDLDCVFEIFEVQEEEFILTS